jgi:3,4-dihydroxy 2-butanone 4-phosphate synthase/GTP cyclohydrolase II
MMGFSATPPPVEELTTQQAADRLGVSRPFVIKLIEEGRLRHRMVGSHRRIPVAELERFRLGGEAAARPLPASASGAQLDSIDDAIRAICGGEMIVVVDDDDRENEGDLIMAAAKASPPQIAFMIRHTSGIVCAPMSVERARALRFEPMVRENDSPHATAFTVSADYREELTTGISAEERARTVQAMAHPNAGPGDFVRPGHIFPLIAREGGVLVRSGHTEAAADLAALAGLPAVGVLAELVNDDGTVKRLPQLIAFAREHGLRIVSIADLITYRRSRERLVHRVAEFEVETQIGPAAAVAYSTPFDSVHHLALVFGDVIRPKSVLVRIHREELVTDVFGRLDEGGSLLGMALERIRHEGAGVVVYLREGCTGVSSPPLARQGSGGGSEARRERHWRDVGIGAQILKDLGLSSICLLTTNRMDYVGLAGFDIDLAGVELIGH